LRSPAYPGNPNLDFTPYQARERDGYACAKDPAVTATLDAAVDAARTLGEYKAAMANLATWEPFFACMAAKGWR
jgi:hypothetical protein